MKICSNCKFRIDVNSYTREYYARCDEAKLEKIPNNCIKNCSFHQYNCERDEDGLLVNYRCEHLINENGVLHCGHGFDEQCYKVTYMREGIYYDCE